MITASYHYHYPVTYVHISYYRATNPLEQVEVVSYIPLLPAGDAASRLASLRFAVMGGTGGKLVSTKVTILRRFAT